MSPQGGEPLRDEPAWSIPSMRDPRYSQLLERGLAVLGVFTPTRPVLGNSDIAEELGMSRSTTHRYVITLVALGYLEQDSARKYRLSLGATGLGMTALRSTPLREHAHSYLLELRQRTSFTASLGVLSGGDVLYVDRVRSFRRGGGMLDLDLHPGSLVPAHCTAMGKLLLASLPGPEQRGLLAATKLTKRAANTITSKRALSEELQHIGAAGFVVSDQELAEEAIAIAVPVRNEADEVIAALALATESSVTSPEELADAVGPQLRASADRISARLGYRPADEIPGGR
jgi:IclR family pca regulon transcriptional regulator